MPNYSDIHYNQSNKNNFNEGQAANLGIHGKRTSYQYNSLSPRGNEFGYALSLACQSGTDMTHTVGNVTAVILQFILDQFPEGTFLTALPSTRIAHRQLKHTPKQIQTQAYPICIVNPRVSLSGLDNRLAAGSFATTLWNTTSNRFQNRSEMPRLFFDKQKGIEWRGKINRVVMYLDFVLAFQTEMEQLRWASYLINRIPTDGGFFDIDTALELAIPDGFLEETAKYAGIPVKDENDDVSVFTNYLNMHSEFPITYRLSSGRHKDAFYSYYMTSLLCNIAELQYSTVTKSNSLVETDCPITFTLRCEFNTIGMFDLSVPNPGQKIIKHASQNAIAIPIFSDFFNENDFPLAYGWSFYAKPIVQLDWSETEVEIGVCLGSMLNELIDYHLKHNIPIELFLSIKLRENRCLIDDGYYVDWKRRILVFTTVNYTHTYRLLIAINKLYINKMITLMYGK